MPFFLHFSGVELVYQFISFVFFMTLIVTWTEINYLTAVKEYRSIIKVFAVATIVTFVVGYLLMQYTALPAITSLFLAVCIGLRIMSVGILQLSINIFRRDSVPHLIFYVGLISIRILQESVFLLTAGLFGHLIIIWSSPIGVQIKGLFYGAPVYDVAALVAFFSILITTIDFVTSVEVQFYPKYKNYFSLFNEGGNISDIENTEKNMLEILRDELFYLAQKQAL